MLGNWPGSKYWPHLLGPSQALCRSGLESSGWMTVSISLESPPDLLVELLQEATRAVSPQAVGQEGAAAPEKVGWVSHLPFL